MNKTDVIAFFDRCAPFWDEDTVRNESVIIEILDRGGICAGSDVLDVACGTGVLFPDYLKRDIKSLTAIDISPQMVKIAKDKYPGVRIICGDVETYPFTEKFDAVMVHNAFPHFPDPQELIRILSTLLKAGGRLSVAHSLSRAALLEHHSGAASTVSLELPTENELASLFAPYLDVDVMISNNQMYMVSGTKKALQ